MENLRHRIDFSIVIPCYNVEKHLVDCINNINKLEYEDFEVVFVDDGSTDNTFSILLNYCDCNDHFRVIHKSNNGQISARECGVLNSNGDYIVFMDADDFFESDSLQKIYDLFQKYDPDSVIFGFRYIKTSGDNILYNDKAEMLVSQKDAIFKILTKESYGAVWRKAFKRKIACCSFNFAPFYKLRYGEDLLQSLVYLNECEKILFSNLIFYNYVDNNNSISHKLSASGKTLGFLLENYIFDTYLDYYSDDKRRNLILSHLIKRACNEIKRVCKFATNNKELADNLNRLKNTDFINKLFSNKKNIRCSLYQKIILYLFHNGRFKLLKLL